jgi:hypothetical protein
MKVFLWTILLTFNIFGFFKNMNTSEDYLLLAIAFGVICSFVGLIQTIVKENN